MSQIDKELDEILADFEIWSHHYSEEKGQTHKQIQPAKAKQALLELIKSEKVKARIDELELIYPKVLKESGISTPHTEETQRLIRDAWYSYKKYRLKALKHTGDNNA